MKNIKLFIILAALTYLGASCSMPGPLYGSWADNRNNTFTFYTDDTFDVRIANPGFPAENYSGRFTLLMNVLTLHIDDGFRIVSEWDIRGNILYLNWTTEAGQPMSLTLFKISN